MPLSPNPLFVGRVQELKLIATALKVGTTGVIAAATGMGGVGKTQLASEFVHRYGHYFMGGIFWLSFAEADGIEAEITACGVAMNLPGFAALEFPDQVARVRQLWQEATPRLLIFDNCEDETLLLKYRPTSGGCRILITSRRSQWSKRSTVTTVSLEILGRAESIDLLRAYRPDLSQNDADAIAQELGDLPLALTLAGSYLEEYVEDPIGQPQTYLTNLRTQLIKHRSLQPDQQGVQASFEISYQRLDTNNPTDALAIAALARAAYFAPGELIMRDLLLASLGPATDDEELLAQRANALKRLINLGLLERPEHGTLRLHRLIAICILSKNNNLADQTAVEQVIINETYEQLNSDYPIQLHTILVHLRFAQYMADPRSDLSTTELTFLVGRIEVILGNYRKARTLYEKAYQLSEGIWGKNHPETVFILNNLANLVFNQGDYSQARLLYEKALEITEKIHGLNHSHTANSLDKLATLLVNQGDFQNAYLLFERALFIREHTLSPNHFDIAFILNNLAGILTIQGKDKTARLYYQRILNIADNILQSKHTHTAGNLSKLATLLIEQGNYQAARPLYEQALKIHELILEPNHPDITRSLCNLAAVLNNLGEYEKAKHLYERALTINAKILGPTHLNNAIICNNLAHVYYKQGNFRLAFSLLEEALKTTEKMLGTNHVDTALNLNNIAILYKDQGNYHEAKNFFERALTIYEQSLKQDHPRIKSIHVHLQHIHNILIQKDTPST